LAPRAPKRPAGPVGRWAVRSSWPARCGPAAGYPPARALARWEVAEVGLRLHVRHSVRRTSRPARV